MTSHGPIATRTSQPRTEEQRRLELAKIEKYQDLEDTIRRKVKQNDFAIDTFQLTSKLLRLNPEYYTIWNIRRRCLISGSFSEPSAGSSPSKASPNSSATTTHTRSSDVLSASSSNVIQQPQDSQTTGKSGTIAEQWQKDLETIKSELEFMMPLLMEFPKCYWIWKYRLWTLEQATKRLPIAAARKIWEMELGLISKMLGKDRRNFHAWGYRRFVVAQLEDSELGGRSMVESEFEYSTTMIEHDLSNFSAWHSRSQLIPRLLNERDADARARRDFLDNELAHIHKALSIDPEDQSLWFYHQYLILNLLEPPGDRTVAPSLTIEEREAYVRREIDGIRDLLVDDDDVKWIYEALIEYTIGASQLAGKPFSEDEQKDLREWLSRLQALDEGRKGRWADLEKRLTLA